MTEYEEKIRYVEHINHDLHHELSELQMALTADEFYEVMHRARLAMNERRTEELKDHIRLSHEIIAERK